MPKNQNEKALPEGGPLERLFNNVTVKILDFLTIHRNYDYSKQDIAKYSGVSTRHALIAIEKLEKLDIIKHTRNVGHAHMYQYNTENPTAKMLYNFSLQLTFDECDKTLEQQTDNEEITII
jgi:hypothetical protein